MLKLNGETKFGFGKINDDKVLAFPNEIQELENTFSFPCYVDPDNGYTVYKYKNNLYTFKELRYEYLKDYYNVK